MKNKFKEQKRKVMVEGKATSLAFVLRSSTSSVGVVSTRIIPCEERIRINYKHKEKKKKKKRKEKEKEKEKRKVSNCQNSFSLSPSKIIHVNFKFHVTSTIYPFLIRHQKTKNRKEIRPKNKKFFPTESF